MNTFTWIETPAWQLSFFGLPNRIPWPTEAPVPDGKQVQFNINSLVEGMNACVNAEPGLIGPWRGFLEAVKLFDPMTEALEDQEYARAAELLGEIEKHHPGSAYGLFHQAYVHRQGGNDQEAVRLYGEAVQKAPGIPFIWDNLGTMLAENGNRDQAVQAFIRAVQVNPEDQVALESLVRLKAAVKLLRDPNDPKSAVVVPMEQFQKMAEQQLEALSQNREQLLQFAETLLRDGVIVEVAVKALEKARDLQPDDPRVLITLGAAYRALGRLDDSKATIARYTEVNPADPGGFFNLAQTANAAGDIEAERAALAKAVELNPNIPQVLGAFFELKPGGDSEKEKQVVQFAEERGAWMPLLLASSMARERGDIPQALAHAAKAYERNPQAEEVLLQYAAMLGDAGNAEGLQLYIQPAVTGGRYSKRLDWNYAQSLRQVGKGALAIEVLRRGQSKEAPDDFRVAAENAIEAWTGFRVQAGAGVEYHTSGQLLRPVLVTLDDGEGGIVLNPRQALPAQGKFSWRANFNDGTEARVRLQQGQNGVGQSPRPLGVFVVKGVKPGADGPATVECRVEADPQGRLYFAAGQSGQKLQVEWAEA